MNKSIIVACILLLMTSVPSVFAETDSSTSSARPEFFKDELTQRKENAKSYLLQRMDNKEEVRSVHKEKIKALHAEFKAKREEYKEKIKELKDTRKKTIVERTDKRLATINQNWVQRMNAPIIKLENLLKKFSDKAVTLKAEGKNTADVEVAIKAADEAILAAKEAVAIQAAKEYIADVSEEEKLKAKVGESMSNLRNDLKLAHETIKTAKQKVIDVARAIAKIHGSKKAITPEATQQSTPSAVITPGI